MKAGAQHEGLSGRCAVTTAALLFSSSKAFPKSLAMFLGNWFGSIRVFQKW